MPPRLYSPDDPHTPIDRGDGPPRLQAHHTYTIEADPRELDDLAAALPRDLLRRSTAGTLQLTFGNAVGRFELPHLGPVEVFTGKLGDDDFTRMLEQLTDALAELPLDAGTAAHAPFERDEDPTHLRWLAFLYLRKISDPAAPAHLQLLPALHAVLHHPHRRLVRDAQWVPLERTRHVDPGRLHQLLTTRAGLTRTGSNLALAAALRGNLPTHVEEVVPRTDLDVPENRFVRHFLDLAQGLVRIFRAVAPTQRPHFRRRLETDCDHIARVLAPVDRHPLWRDLGPLARLPLDSTVLQRARGYKDILRHYLRLRQSTRLPLEPSRAAELLELKDIATLYELWTYFTVARVLTDLLGPPRSAGAFTHTDLRANAPWGFHHTWPQGHTLHYNLSFSRGRPRRFSYALPLRPDIALEITHGANAGLHLFDAKFRLHRIPDPLAEDDDPEQPSFRRDDIHKMHTYRDALGARTVWILYPGEVFKFYPTDRNLRVIKKATDLPTAAMGVGSVPLMPGQHDAAELREILLRLGASDPALPPEFLPPGQGW